jgi:hypothetical protein
MPCCSEDGQASNLNNRVKFLLWQFFFYALAAMFIGMVLASVWARSTRAGLKRAFERAQRALTAERETNARLRRERASDALLLGEAHELANKLAELRGTISLVDADLQANQMGRDEAERSRSRAEEQLGAERGFQVRAKRAEAELSRVRNELQVVQGELATVRAEMLGRLAELERDRDSVAMMHRSLQAIHDEFLVTNQSSYTEALLRAEEAESLVTVRDAELERITQEFAAVVAVVRRQGNDSSGPSSLSSPVEIPKVVDLEASPSVIDLRAADHALLLSPEAGVAGAVFQ